jgi:hypothetical protein
VLGKIVWKQKYSLLYFCDTMKKVVDEAEKPDIIESVDWLN